MIHELDQLLQAKDPAFINPTEFRLDANTIIKGLCWNQIVKFTCQTRDLQKIEDQIYLTPSSFDGHKEGTIATEGYISFRLAMDLAGGKLVSRETLLKFWNDFLCPILFDKHFHNFISGVDAEHKKAEMQILHEKHADMKARAAYSKVFSDKFMALMTAKASTGKSTL
jgi:hypothetical protein